MNELSHPCSNTEHCPVVRGEGVKPPRPKRWIATRLPKPVVLERLRAEGRKNETTYHLIDEHNNAQGTSNTVLLCGLPLELTYEDGVDGEEFESSLDYKEHARFFDAAYTPSERRCVYCVKTCAQVTAQGYDVVVELV